MRNLADKITDDSSKIIITVKSVKWIFGILFAGVLGIFGFAWGLYIAVDSKVDKVKEEIIEKMEQLDREKVKPIGDKNNNQDVEIARLYGAFIMLGPNSSNMIYPSTGPTSVSNVPPPPALNRK